MTCSPFGVNLLEPERSATDNNDSARAGFGGEVAAAGGVGVSSGGAASTGGSGATAATDGSAGAPAPVTVRVLLVTDQVAAGFDGRLETRLETRGFAVTRLSELDIVPSSADGFDLVVVSPSADGFEFGMTLADSSKPLLLLEPTVAQSHGLGNTASVGADDALVFASTHPIVDPLSGTVVLCSAAETLQGLTGVTGEVLGTASQNDSVAVLSAFEAGTTVPGGVLAGRRVVFGLLKTAHCRPTEALELFDRAADWLLAG